MIRFHLDSFESAEQDLSFSVYRTGDGGALEVWVQVGAAHFKLPIEYLDDLAEMLGAIREYLEGLIEEENIKDSLEKYTNDK